MDVLSLACLGRHLSTQLRCQSGTCGDAFWHDCQLFKPIWVRFLSSICDSFFAAIHLSIVFHHSNLFLSPLTYLSGRVSCENKCRLILVQGLRRGIEINFHINKIYGSVAQWIKCLAGELKYPGSSPSQGDFFT